MTTFIGMDANGVRDQVCRWREGRSPEIETGGLPACVVLAEGRVREALAGIDAAAAVEGRGWLWPRAAHGGGQEPRRRPLLDLWSAFLDNERLLPRDRELLGAYLRALLRRDREAVAAVPDPLDEDRQEALLDAARQAGLDLTLLWRPVAVLLGFAEGLPRPEFHTLDGRTALLLHLGALRAEATVLDLEVETAAGRRLLTPVRRRHGWTTRSWYGLQLAREIAEREARTLGGGDALGWQLLWGSGYAWRPLVGEDARPELVQRDDGSWQLLTASPAVPDADEDFAAALEGLVEKIHAKVDLALVEGPLVRCSIRSGISLGERARRVLSARFSLDPERAIRALAPEEACAARGAAVYAHRRAHGLPTYYDFLPQIAINAVRERRVGFVDLVRGQARIAGGQAYEGEVAGFRVQAGTPELVFYLAYGGEDEVRRTATRLPHPPAREVAVTLRVTQRPAAGHARVALHPELPDGLGPRRIFVDWSTLERTGETRCQALARLQQEIGFAYPDCDPMRAHWTLWADRDAASKIVSFLQTPPLAECAQPALYDRRLRDLAGLFRANRIPPAYVARFGGDRSRYGLVDAFGQLPPDLSPHCRLPPGFNGWNDILQKFLARITDDFGFSWNIDGDINIAGLRRRLYALATWCYAAAPEPVLTFLRQQLHSPTRDQWSIEAIGRSFTAPGDVGLFLHKAVEVLPDHRGPLRWMKATALILQYREDAPQQLDAEGARVLTEVAERVLAEQVRQNRTAQLFFNAALLLLGILRVRRHIPAFLMGQADDPCSASLRARLRDTLARAARIARRDPRRAALIQDIINYVEGRGTNQLIFRDVGDLTE